MGIKHLVGRSTFLRDALLFESALEREGLAWPGLAWLTRLSLDDRAVPKALDAGVVVTPTTGIRRRVQPPTLELSRAVS